MKAIERLFARLFGGKEEAAIQPSAEEAPQIMDSSLFPDDVREQIRAMNAKAKWPGQEEIEELRRQLAESDRRAGAAEREVMWLRSNANARQSWLDKAKDRAGYDRSVSFDVVFDDLLAARDALREAREALQFANDSPGGGISDTIWMMHRPETLFDFIDAALAGQLQKTKSESIEVGK